MGDTLIIIVVIGLSAVLMFIFPLMTMSDRTDDVSQLTVNTATTEFVDSVITTGKLTLDKYSKFVENISSTGNAYDVEMELKVLDENPGKKTTQSVDKRIGENVYYSKYTSQILDELDKTPIMLLKEGDVFIASAKNKTPTMSQQLKNFFYSVIGNDTYTIAAEHAGIVSVTGSNYD